MIPPPTPSKKLTLPDEAIDNLIREIRGQKVILDSDLAMFCGVEARSLNQAVARNRTRFPANILRSPRAVQMSVFVIRAFVKMRETLLGTQDLAKKTGRDSRKSSPTGSTRMKQPSFTCSGA